MAVFLGCTYYQAGRQGVIFQVGAICTVLQTAFLATMMAIAEEDGPKLIVKLEEADQLYSIGIYIIVRLLVHWLYSSLAALPYYLITFYMLDLPRDGLGEWFLWGYLGRWAVEALLFNTVAIGKTVADGQQKLVLPVLTVFLFNGLSSNFKNVPKWMEWGLYVSPSYWAVENLSLALYKDSPLKVAALEEGFGFRSGVKTAGLIFLVCYQVVCRVINVVAYVKLHKPEK